MKQNGIIMCVIMLVFGLVLGVVEEVEKLQYFAIGVGFAGFIFLIYFILSDKEDSTK